MTVSTTFSFLGVFFFYACLVVVSICSNEDNSRTSVVSSGAPASSCLDGFLTRVLRMQTLEQAAMNMWKLLICC